MPLLSPLNPALPAWGDARVWIIGASYGIGAAVARKLLVAGARVTLSEPDKAKFEDVAMAPRRRRSSTSPRRCTSTAAEESWRLPDQSRVVKTPLTDRNEFKIPHLIGAEEAADAIVQGMERGGFEIDFPKAFSRQLKLLRHLPYRLYFAAVRRATKL